MSKDHWNWNSVNEIQWNSRYLAKWKLIYSQTHIEIGFTQQFFGVLQENKIIC